MNELKAVALWLRDLILFTAFLVLGTSTLRILINEPEIQAILAGHVDQHVSLRVDHHRPMDRK